MAEREVITVEADEQINGLIRRLRQSGARQVTFLVPETAAVLRSPVNLRLLRFYADQEQKTVQLLTGDAVVQRLADEAGVEWTAAPEEAPAGGTAALRAGETPGQESGDVAPAAQDPWAQLVEAQGAAAREERTAGNARTAPTLAQRLPKPSLRHLVWLPALLLVLAAWQLLAGPAVTVTIQPALKEFTRDVTLRGETGGGELPLSRLEQAVEATASVETTGHRRFGVAAARGTVTFLNQGTKPVTVPSSTVLVTAAGTAFRMTEAVKVPGVSTDYYMKIPVGVRSGQAEARVVAVVPGSDGNVSAGRLTRFRDGAPSGVQVTNPEPTRGGEDRTVAVVTAADLDRAKRAAEAALATQARPSLEALLAKGHELIPDSLRVGEITVEAAAAAEGEASTVSATAKGIAVALEFEPAAARRAAAAAAGKLAPSGFTVLPKSVTAGAPRFARVEAGLAEIVVPVTGRLVSPVDPDTIRQAARGKSRDEAEAALRRVSGVGEVNITGGGRRLPSWSGRLRVKVASPSEGL